MTGAIATGFFIALSLVIAWLSCRRYANPQSIFYLPDRPNERSLHSQPTPRSGGIGILLAIAITWPMVFIWNGGSPHGIAWLLAGLFLVAAVSLLDDIRHLSPFLRLAAHVCAAVLLLRAGAMLTLPFLSSEHLQSVAPMLVWGLNVLAIVWFINLYNFMDGMDGFAGGMGLIGFGFLALAAWASGHTIYATLAVVIAAANAGFLVVNFPPARIFMGDAGSSSLGYLAASFLLWGNQEAILPWWLTLLVFSPFVVDGTVTLLRRSLRGERIWLPHRNHYYQRLVQMGWGHRRTVLCEYGLMLASGVSAMAALGLSERSQELLIAGWALIYIALMFYIGRLERRHAATRSAT